MEKKIKRTNSRIGDNPIVIPSGVEVKSENGKVIVKGAKGSLEVKRPEGVDLNIEEGKVIVVNLEKSKKAKPFHGLLRALVNNMIIGVSQGFEKVLLIEGVGYKAAVQGKILDVNVGYSNPVKYQIPEDVSIEVVKNTYVKISGIDKVRVGQTAAEIRKIRPPEPYKGKGIRYENEYIKRKVGKSGAKG
ncbi:MAG: 50S ribosomal protein L6 [Spirochaetes bacterium]|nr:50S ribosomal protein L6 [Spirochaetota bacterium]MCK5266934.1 50S ribosomal protein L6 [Spirochaetota bacterium]